MESIPTVISLAKEFDYLYKKTYDRVKIIEVLISQLLEKIDSEDKLTKNFEKLSLSIPRNGGEFDDLLQALKVDLSQRATQNKIFKQSFQEDIDAISAKLKQTNLQIKPLMQEAEKSDKDIKTLYEKMDRAKEKCLKLNKEHEELILTIQAGEWNRDLTADSKEKLLGKLGFLNSQKVESEQALQQMKSQYNTQVQITQDNFNTQSKTLKSIYSELFFEFKNLIMKELVLDISRQRNLQYDTEQFFKEVEKYEQQADFYVVPEQFNYNLACVKQDFQVQEFSSYFSYLTNLSRQAIQSNKQLTKYKSSEQQQICKTPSFLEDEQFNKQYAELCQNMIRKAHNKVEETTKTTEPIESQITEQKDKNEETSDSLSPSDNQKPDENKVQDPLAKPKTKQITQPKKTQLSLDQFLNNFASLDDNRLQNYIETAKIIINQSTADSHKLETTKTFEDLVQQLNQQETKEICTFVLEQFSNAQVTQLSNVGLKNIGIFCDQLIKQVGFDIVLIRRLLLVFQNLFKIFDSSKIYLIEIVKLSIDIQRNDLWLGVLFLNVQEELIKNPPSQPKLFDKEQQLKEKQQFTQQIQNLANMMFTMKIEKSVIRTICQKCAVVLGIQEMQIQDLYNFIERDGRQEFNSKTIQPLNSNVITRNEITQQSAKVIIFDKKNVNQPLIQTSQTQNQLPSDPLTSSIIKSGKLPIPNPLVNTATKKEPEEKKSENTQVPIKDQAPAKEIKPVQPLGLLKKQQEPKKLEQLFGIQRYEDNSKQKEEQKESEDPQKNETSKKVEDTPKKVDNQVKRSGDPLGAQKPRMDDPLGAGKPINKNNPLDRKR